MLGSLLDDAGDPRHVLVRRVGAAADEAVLDLERPAVLLGRGALDRKSESCRVIFPAKHLLPIPAILAPFLVMIKYISYTVASQY
jgi:hypothetical protein